MRSLILTLLAGVSTLCLANAEPQVRATENIIAYEIQGVNLTMAPKEVRDAILAAGFQDVSAAIPGLWEFQKGHASMSVTHYGGQVESIGYSLIAQDNGYIGELDRMRETFAINVEEAGSNCSYTSDRGGTCGVLDATDQSQTVTAYVQGMPMMLNMSVSRTDLRR